MPFNKHTFRANQSKAEAWKAIADARALKNERVQKSATADADTVVDDAKQEVRRLVSRARFHMHNYVHHRLMGKLKRKLRHG